MKTKSFSPVGSLHPILFFAVIYAVALFFAIFICSALFYSCNASPSHIGKAESKPVNIPVEQAAVNNTITVAMR